MNFRVRVGDTKVTPAEVRAVTEVLRSGQWSPGPKCKEFEERFAWTHGAKYGVFVNSGTDALRIAVAALKEAEGWQDGDHVIVPATTFVATINVVLQNGLVPHLADNGLKGFNVDRLNSFSGDNARFFYGKPTANHYEKSKAIMPVHLCGNRPDPVSLLKFAKSHKLKVIEDSCESMGVGPLFGDIACYSTYVCHIMTTGVGGIAITNSKRLADLMRSYANHGRDISGIPGNSTRPFKSRFKYDRIGYSSRATEMQAALGLEQLKHLRYNISARQAIAEALFKGLEPLYPALELPPLDPDNAFMMFPIVLNPYKTKIKRDSLCNYLEKSGIETRPLLPLIDQPCYKGMPWMSKAKAICPHSAHLLDNGFYVGCHPGMTSEDVKHIIKTIAIYMRQN